MSTTANPLGAGGDVTKAVPRISAFLKQEAQPEPQGQPEQPPAEQGAPAEANRDEKPRNERGQFARSEPQTEIEEPKPEGADVEDAPESTPAEQPDSEHEELADTIDGLAKQLGMEPEDLANHLSATVKIGGEERRANLKDLIAGYQKGEDYTRKTAELAEKRRAFDAEQQAYQQQRDHIASQLSPLVQQLEQLVVSDDQLLQKLLNEGDILEYERVKFASEQRRAQLASAKQEQQRITEEKQREAHIKLQHDVAQNEQLLVEAHPEWAKDVEKGKKELGQIRQYLKAEGVPVEAVESLYDAKSLLIAEKAMKWDKLQKEKIGRLQEVRAAPKFQKPGAVRPAEDPKRKVHSANLNRLRKSGNVRDAAKALLSGGFVQR